MSDRDLQARLRPTQPARVGGGAAATSPLGGAEDVRVDASDLGQTEAAAETARRLVTDADFESMAAQGFNAVRLLVSWSRLEPTRGKVDAAYLREIRTTVRQAAEQLGGIDCIVNLAGIGRAQDAGDLPDAEARRTVEINLFGTWTATAAAMPWLVESHGHVVVTASGLAIATMPFSAIGVSNTRCLPYFFCRPSVTRNTPPKKPTSSPMTTILSSRSNMTWWALLSAWIMFIAATCASPPARRPWPVAAPSNARAALRTRR